MAVKGHVNGDLESIKFDSMREPYYKGLETIKALNYDIDDFVHHFPCFVGHFTLSRFLTLYEIYKMVSGVSGHIAEVGVFKGASLMMFTKLVQLYESNAFTQVHGFDWFQGCEPGIMDKNLVAGGDAESYDRVKALIEAQGLDHIAKLHVVDVRKDLEKVFTKYPHLQFKLVFLDAGTYENMQAALPYFWERLTPGGILLLDQFNHELAPGEVRAVKEFLPDAQIRTIPNSWMPTAYIVK